jgi:hypothetical protein
VYTTSGGLRGLCEVWTRLCGVRSGCEAWSVDVWGRLAAERFHFSAFGASIAELGRKLLIDGRWDLATLDTKREVGLAVTGMRDVGLVHALGSHTQDLDIRLDGFDFRLQGVELGRLRRPFCFACCGGGAERGHATTVRTNMVVIRAAAGLDDMLQDTITI